MNLTQQQTRRETSGRLRLFETQPHTCGYLPGRAAATLVADPDYRKNARVLGALTALGFRRSGDMVYRPHCPGCSACVPVRVPVREFRPRRSQRRVIAANAGLEATLRDGRFDEEHFALYERYIAERHGDGSMADPTPEDYMRFLTAPWCDTLFIEFRDCGRLLAVAVSDVLEDAWSAVYTFFEPDAARRSLGTYAVLWQVEALRRAGLDWLYLGYWIDDCQKMSYKRDYRPQEHFGPDGWRRAGPSG